MIQKRQRDTWDDLAEQMALCIEENELSYEEMVDYISGHLRGTIGLKLENVSIMLQDLRDRIEKLPETEAWMVALRGGAAAGKG